MEEEEEGIGEVIVGHWWGPIGELGAVAQPGVLLEESWVQVRELLKPDLAVYLSLPSGDWHAGGNPSPWLAAFPKVKARPVPVVVVVGEPS